MCVRLNPKHCYMQCVPMVWGVWWRGEHQAVSVDLVPGWCWHWVLSSVQTPAHITCAHHTPGEDTALHTASVTAGGQSEPQRRLLRGQRLSPGRPSRPDVSSVVTRVSLSEEWPNWQHGSTPGTPVTSSLQISQYFPAMSQWLLLSDVSATTS